MGPIDRRARSAGQGFAGGAPGRTAAGEGRGVPITLADQWSRHLFVALLRRYGVSPYRYRRQRRTTVMARLSRSFVDDTLWPEFLELQSTLVAYCDALTDQVIEQTLEVKAGEAEERGEEPPAAPRLQPVDYQGSLL